MTAATLEAQTEVLSEGPFRAHFENLPDAAYLWQRRGNTFDLLALNRAARELSFARISDVSEQARDHLLSDPTFVADMTKCIETGSVVAREVEYTYLISNITRQLATTFVPVPEDMVVVHAQDITERKAAERQLQESIERYECSARGTNDGLWDWNILTGEVYFSPRWKEILGYGEDELSPCVDTFTELLHPDDRGRTLDSVQAHLTERVPYERAFRLRHKAGRYVWVESRGQATWNEAGEPLRMAGAVRDITEQRAIEQEIIAIAESERRRIGRDLHDGLGQELTGISLGLQTLSEQLARECSQHEHTMRDLTAMVQKAIVDTQRFARVLSPGFSQDVRLSESLMALAAEINEHSGVSCEAHCSDTDDPHDEKVATHLFRIAQESINNALKHGEASLIELNFRREGNALVLEILDDGVGIPVDQSQLEGLGLKNMRYRARMLNGTLTVTPRASGGTRVFCSCPLNLRLTGT